MKNLLLACFLLTCFFAYMGLSVSVAVAFAMVILICHVAYIITIIDKPEISSNDNNKLSHKEVVTSVETKSRCKIIRNLSECAIPILWLAWITYEEGELSLPGVIFALFLTMCSYVIIVGLREIIQRVKNKQPLINFIPEGPSKPPLWYRILSIFFRDWIVLWCQFLME